MERMDMQARRNNRVRRRVSGRLCALLVIALLAGGLPTGVGMSTYAVEAAELGEGYGDAKPTVAEEDDITGTPEDDDLGGNDASTVTPEPAVPTEPGAEAVPTPEPTKDAEEAEPTPTKEPETGEATLTPEPTKDAEDATPTPTKQPGNADATPTPTKQPGNVDVTPTPTKKPGNVDVTPTPTKEPGKEETTPEPTPTKKPNEDKVTPTPEPTGDAQVTEPAPTEEPDEVTPTPKPTKTPSWAVPTESDDARYQYLLGIDAKVISIDDPPEGYKSAAEAAKNMKTITIPVWKMTASGRKYTSSAQLTVNKKLAKNVLAIFKEIYALDIKFPIKVVKGYGYRKVGGVGLSKSRIMSIHSFGAAIDINPSDYDNDYFLGKGNDLRDKSNPYCIPDEVIAVFEKYGWFWGGNFEICADTMHFQYFELGMLTYQGNSPFRTLKVKSGYMTGTDVRNLQQRLCELGFAVSIDGVYGNKTANAVKKYQKSRGLEETGQVDYKTWETIINETHYMAYAF